MREGRRTLTWIRSESDRLRDVIVSPPLSSYGDVDLRVHNWHSHPDLARAAEEHRALVATLEAEGATVHIVSGDASLPNHIYPRDTGLVGPAGVWLGRFCLPTREGEIPRIRRALAAIGVPVTGTTQPPGTFEGGGDAFLVGRVAFVATSARTNAEGASQVAGHLRSLGVDVRMVPVSLSFHLGEPLGIVDEGTLLVDERWADEPAFRDFARIEVPASEVGGGNVLVMAPRKLVIHAGYPETLRRLEKEGVEVLPMNLTELKKAGGGPQCLTLPVRRG